MLEKNGNFVTGVTKCDDGSGAKTKRVPKTVTDMVKKGECEVDLDKEKVVDPKPTERKNTKK